MQRLVALTHAAALPEDEMAQAQAAVQEAKEDRWKRLDKSLAKLTAHSNNLHNTLQLCMQSERTTARPLQLACANLRQLEVQEALHEHISGIAKGAYECGPTGS